jgi:hypothetical protein
MTKSKPTITIHNVETGEIIEREMTDQEFAEVQIKAEFDAKMRAEAEAKEAQRQALFEKLGITADEAKLLLG